MSFLNVSPPPQEVIAMEPESLAPLILRYLQQQPADSINRYNFSLIGDQSSSYQTLPQYGERLMEAWMYLERQGFLAPRPGQSGDWMFITRKGRAVVEDQDFETYRQAHLLPAEILDPILLQKVRPTFIVGDYDTAVFQAFKEVEVRVRKKAKLSESVFGVDLMRRAFRSADGILTDKTSPTGEQVARMEFFAGAIGMCKNPSSHRDVAINAKEASDLIHTANHLLRVVDSLPDLP